MNECYCDRCLGIEATNQGRRWIGDAREPIERWMKRVDTASEWSSGATCVLAGVMILGFAWHALFLALGWHDPTDHGWVYGLVVGTFATSLLGWIATGTASSRLSDIARSLELAESHLALSVSNATAAQSAIKRERDGLRLIA